MPQGGVTGIITLQYVGGNMAKIRKTDIYLRYAIPTLVTVQIDTREKYPLLFPDIVKIANPERSYLMLPIQVVTQHIKLDSGDYRLKEYPTDCIIERKASQLEIFKMPKLPENRKKRYMQKILHGRNRIELVEVWQQEKISEHETKSLVAIEKAAQEVIEVATDLMAMILKDTSIPPTDDYTNISRVLELGLITKEVGAILKEANGLRNRLIHVYNDVDIDILLESIKRVLPGISEFLNVVEKWLSRN